MTTGPAAAAASDPQPSGPTRGAFIVFEGIDCCGKTTQSSLLFQHLQDRNVKVEKWAFPDRSTATTGQRINAYLKDKSVQLDPVAVHRLFVDNRMEKRQALAAALAAGITIVCDRYSYSGIAYDTAKALPGLSLKECRAWEEGLPAPDAVLYMRIGVSAMQQRLHKRDGANTERYENPEFQAKVIQGFEELLPDALWTCFDGEQDKDTLHAQVAACADRVVNECHGPVARLWDGKPYEDLAHKAAAI